MLSRNQSSANESLAAALSRVVVTRDEPEADNYSWATLEGRGDRMPRFLERAIQDVPHAAARNRVTASTAAAVEDRKSRPLTKIASLLSVAAVAAGVYVSIANPEALKPVFSALPAALVPQANAAMPRLAFGEVLRNYSLEAAAQASRANIVVRDVAPGTTLSAGERVTDTEWTLPQSQLDNLVITFPRDVPPSGMRATMKIPGNAQASSGSFSVELRQAEPVAETNAAPVVIEPVGEVEAVAKVEAAPETKPAPARKARVQRKDADEDKAVKRKVKPSAALTPKRAPSEAVQSASAAPPAAAASADDEAPSLLGALFSGGTNSAAATTNQTTMFSLGAFAPE